MTEKGAIQELIQVLHKTFADLHASVPSQELEAIAITVHNAMSVEGRHFHTPEHILGLVETSNPVQSLAAMFHDLVYYQVDHGFSPEVFAFICPYLQESDAGFFLLQENYPTERPFRMALEIFDFSLGQTLTPDEGLNEFASALVMCHKLSGLVPEKELLQAIAFIEATIPFRADAGTDCQTFAALEARLARTCARYQVLMTPQEIEQTVQGAVLFANRDVENFAEPSPASFLDNTWKLLPENNIALRTSGQYSIREYRQALQRMHSFLCLLTAEQVFHQYKGAPPQAQYQRLLEAARHNIETARTYLGIKLLTIALLEALADVSGGDAPVSLFMGDLRKHSADQVSLEDYLPPVQAARDIDPSSDVYSLLETGRASQLDFDLRNSPLSLFIYSTLGPQKVRQYLVEAKAMFAGHLTAHEFLQRMDSRLVSDIAEACAAMVVTRREKLSPYIHQEKLKQGGSI